MAINTKKIVRYLAAFILFCIFVELTARFDDWVEYDAPFWGTYSSLRLRSWDDEGTRINIPNGDFEKWKNNSAGFRGPEISMEKRPGVTRIVCLGASESYGLYESPGMEWPAQLRMELDSTKFEIINVASVGLPMVQYVDYLRKYVMKYSPDAAILYIEPVSYVAARERAINNPESIIKNPKQQQAARQLGIRGKLNAWFRAVPKLQRAIKQFLPSSIMAEYNRRAAEEMVQSAELTYLKGMTPLDDVPSEIIEEYKTELKKIIAFLLENNCQPILCTYPSLIDGGMNDDNMTMLLEARRFVVELSLEGMANTARRLNEANRGVAEVEHLPLIELENAVPRTTEYFADNVHYTDTGAEIVARTIADFLRTNL
ncbi:MAG: hypothetical protein R3F48_05510 [Candidatus Zixiibacteriota bacterium]